MATQTQLVNAIKGAAPSPLPWSLLDATHVYDASMQSPLRTSTMVPALHVYPAILEAAALCGISDPATRHTNAFRMIKRNNNAKTEIFVEVQMPDDTSLLVMASETSLRISVIETDGTTGPALRFKDMDLIALKFICLALMPHVLDIDNKEGNSKINDAVKALGGQLDLTVSNPWTDKNDIPDIAKDAAYFLDVVATVIKDKMKLDCGDKNSEVPGEIPNSAYRAGHIGGSLIMEDLGTWKPKVLTASGSTTIFSGTTMTIKEAKEKYAFFMAHRNWTPQERMLIPQFADNAPVMPEVLRIAKRFVDTKGDVNPVCNAMWRGVTSYGKSTGVRQLGCILNMPLLTMTCHPGMEAQDLQSQFVPDAKTEGILLNMENVATTNNGDSEPAERPPFFDDAIAYLQSLDEEARKEILNASAFFSLAVMDSDAAAKKLLGKESMIETEDLCWLYSEVCSAIREIPLRNKLKEYASVNGQDANKDDSPEFVHVVSPYLKAMVNGYLVEIQEASRIRDSGVMVSINEFNRPSAVMPLGNGALARRHKDALCIITDNVGYASCRPIDPSVLRRQSLIIDSYELPKELLLDRVQRNTGVTDKDLLELGYKLWNCVKEFCEQNGITEGSVSPMELECFIQAVKYDGMDSIGTNLDDCIISKATSSIEDQRDIRTACQTIYGTI